MYKVKVIEGFSSAHFLREYKGKCESLHGHNWKVEAVVSSRNLNHLGLVIDFGDLKQSLRQITNSMDHKLLNEMDFFRTHNPTSENIARYIYNELKQMLAEGLVLEKIKVWEKDTSCAVYQE